jgi:glycosyltransferase involved in cell wall biosynthesis
MKLTVAICTWNRCGLLDQTMNRLQQLRVPAGAEWELLVVNNNCTDATEDVLARHAGRLPLRRLFEPTPGLSRARNRAVAAARGDYLLWTDDDVLVDEGWLEAYAAAFRRWPEAAVFGGPIHPWFEGEAPEWLVRIFPRVAHAFAATDPGTEPAPLEPPHLPFGANMAMRLAEQRRHLYDPDLGVRPHLRLGGEETAVIQAILSAGGSGRWVPEARVRHFIPAPRQTVAYLRSYYFGYGHNLARQMAGDRAAHWLGRPRWVWRRALASECRFWWNRLHGRPERWIEDLIAASTARGILHGYPAVVEEQISGGMEHGAADNECHHPVLQRDAVHT